MNLEHLISVIQKGALAASTAVQDKNMKLLDLYFEEAGKDDISMSLKEALAASINIEDEDQAEELAQKVIDSISPEMKGVFNKGKLKPKTVTIQYPKETSKGIVAHEVIVPLFSIAPISLMEMSQVKFKTDLEISLVDDELSISFPEKGATSEDSTKNIANLEVVIDKSLPPDGLRKIVEAYDRVIRAQVPL